MVNLARSLAATEDEANLKEAEDLLTVATSIETDNAFAWHELSVVLEKQGRRAEAQLAIAEQAFHYDNCQRALSFSGRAVRELEYNSPKYIRAADITTICTLEVQRNPRR